MQQDITALILAGGKSSRMGQDKALLPYRNQTLLSSVCNVAQESANCVYVVTPWTEKYQAILPNFAKLISETLIYPETQANFPLMGFFQGLQQVTTPWILLLACDLPNLNSQTITGWYPNLTQAPPDMIALLPRHPQGWEPLCGFYRRNCQASLKNYVDSGGKSFQNWLNQSVVGELPLSDRSMLFNCNTPEDWKTIVTAEC
ncbi:MAG TPA: molybdenum cofactor guanylyltransferase, partial [Xenococcaceae cyanobacterium]